MHEQPSLELDPALVEEAILLFVEKMDGETRRRFRAERDALYEVHDADAREAAFADLHRRWLDALEIARPLTSMLREDRVVRSGVSRCRVVKGVRAQDEYADLCDGMDGVEASSQDKPALLLRLRPQTLIEEEDLRCLLRRELLFIADLLDPTFGAPRRPPAGAGAMESLYRDRYRLLWEITVEGRIARGREQLPAGTHERRSQELRAAFPRLTDPEATFAALFLGPRPSHAELWRLATGGGEIGAQICPLCRLPVASLCCEAPSASVQRAIRRDFPGWRPVEGICRQCADLYATRISNGALDATIASP